MSPRFLYELPRDVVAGLLAATPPAKPRGRPLPALKSADWQALAADANRHAVGILVHERLRNHGLDELVPEDVAASWRADSLHAQLQHQLQSRHALEISTIFDERGLEHAFLKGFAYRHAFYDPAWVRVGGDVDVLVRREDVESARAIIKSLGFTQAKFSLDHQRYWRASPLEIAEVEDRHYELAEFNKVVRLTNPPKWLLAAPFVQRSPFAFGTRGSAPVLHSSIDVHWTLHFVFARSQPLDDIHRTMTSEGMSIPVLSVEWNLLFSMFKLYVEVFDRPGFGFTHLSDLIGLLQLNEEIKWDWIYEAVSRHKLEAAAYYTFSAAEQLLDDQFVPAPIMDAWTGIAPPDENPREGPSLDFGNFLPFLVGFRSVQNFAGSSFRRTPKADKRTAGS